jgi:hypothetical protein
MFRGWLPTLISGMYFIGRLMNLGAPGQVSNEGLYIPSDRTC